LEGAEVEIAVSFLNRVWKASFRPCEIKTFIIQKDWARSSRDRYAGVH